MAKNKSKKPQGHPARVARDDTNIEIEKLSMRLVKLVPTVIRDPRFDPEDMVIAKASSVGILHLYSVLDGKPSPFELYKQQMAHARKTLKEIQELHKAVPHWTKPDRPKGVPAYICGHCAGALGEVVEYPCETRKLADSVAGVD